ncbi:protein dachsous-like [Ruditapes philippinarum]|uniref:protein dachsous-like n=1 Tax=Ruditapes philippinarum TaxID=129788 RepID=UPI00295C252D|nr:protein dachsous-like [Ruditapes philippinarum]
MHLQFERGMKMCGVNRVELIVAVLAHFLINVAAVCSNNAVVTLKYELKEGLPPGSEVGNIAERLSFMGYPNLGPPYTEFFFLEDWVKEVFQINYSTGLITAKRSLDRETNDSFSFSIQKGEGYICINVTVLDINDNAPVFSLQDKNLSVPDGAPHHIIYLSIPEGAPHHIFSLGSVQDKDIGENTIQGFRFVSANDDHALNVKGRYSGPQKVLLDLVVNGTLDYETTPHYTLLVEVYDGGKAPCSHFKNNKSKFSAPKFENATRGTSVLQVQATDIDQIDQGKITYSIDSKSNPDGVFVIDSVSGIITLDKLLDYETKKYYQIIAIASDQTNPSRAVVEIEVLNINEIPANIYITYLTSDATPRIPENALKGVVVARVSVSDPEAPDTDNSDIAVSLQGGENRFKLEPTSSGTFKLLVDQPLDRESKAVYNLTLVAADSGSPPLSASKSFLLQILDINDNAPIFSKNFLRGW